MQKLLLSKKISTKVIKRQITFFVGVLFYIFMRQKLADDFSMILGGYTKI